MSASTGTGEPCEASCTTDSLGAQIPGLDLAVVPEGECHFGQIDCGQPLPVCVGAVGRKSVDAVCGPSGKDDDCDGVVGYSPTTCTVATIYTLLQGATNCVMPMITDGAVSNVSTKTGFDSALTIPIKAFGFKYAGLVPVHACLALPSTHTFTINQSCAAAGYSDDGNGTPIGFVSTVQKAGYEQLYDVTTATMAQSHVLVPLSQVNATMCFGTFLLLPYFVPT